MKTKFPEHAQSPRYCRVCGGVKWLNEHQKSLERRGVWFVRQRTCKCWNKKFITNEGWRVI